VASGTRLRVLGTERDQLNESARGRNQAKNMRSIFFDNPGPDARYS